MAEFQTLQRWLRISDVRALIPVSETTIRKWVREGRFPKPVRVDERTGMWTSADVAKWMLEREAER